KRIPLLAEEEWLRRVKRGADGWSDRRADDFAELTTPALSRHPSSARRGICSRSRNENTHVWYCNRCTVRERRNYFRTSFRAEFRNRKSSWADDRDRKSTRLNSSHVAISYAV